MKEKVAMHSQELYRHVGMCMCTHTGWEFQWRVPPEYRLRALALKIINVHLADEKAEPKEQGCTHYCTAAQRLKGYA